MKKCMYCRREIDGENLVDFCESCGVGVFGVKMYQAIVSNMREANDRGDLNQGMF